MRDPGIIYTLVDADFQFGASDVDSIFEKFAGSIDKHENVL